MAASLHVQGLKLRRTICVCFCDEVYKFIRKFKVNVRDFMDISVLKAMPCHIERSQYRVVVRISLTLFAACDSPQMTLAIHDYPCFSPPAYPFRSRLSLNVGESLAQLVRSKPSSYQYRSNFKHKQANLVSILALRIIYSNFSTLLRLIPRLNELLYTRR